MGFLHIQSGAAPQIADNGEYRLSDESGIILVLIPGGQFWMGAEPRPDPARPKINVDPRARKIEAPSHPISLAPFFLSKYEPPKGNGHAFSHPTTAPIQPVLNLAAG